MIEVKKYSLPNSRIPDWLFIFEMANNHMGDVDHGIRIIKEFAAVAKDFDFKFAFKLQYRDMKTFVHPDYQGRYDVRLVKRFSETDLTKDQRRRLLAAIRDAGFISICTAFDEASVDAIVDDGYDFLKIASCSFSDWPLLEKAAQCSLPIVISCGGSALERIDNVVAFLKHRNKDFVLMHCVAEYPTTNEKLQINQLSFLQARYPGVRIGYSTHEAPTETLPVAMAITKGCRIFEKHVGVPTETIKLNGYSATPEQTRTWLEAATLARKINGSADERPEMSEAERKSLGELYRGVFVKHAVKAGQRLTLDDVFFSIPAQPGNILAQDWSKYTQVYATEDIAKNRAVTVANSRSVELRDKIYFYVQQVKGILNAAGVKLPGQVDLEISHHYGIEKFDKFGITVVTVVNREYCKRLIIVLPGQTHPEQYHKVKEETFHVLYGDVAMKLDGKVTKLRAGDVSTVERNVRHGFSSLGGAIIEEISSNYAKEDTFYTDPAIGQYAGRKTFLTYWM
jgi:sialic acid synthase SpsE/quercetin dioxygenase-like cupin family protein